MISNELIFNQQDYNFSALSKQDMDSVPQIVRSMKEMLTAVLPLVQQSAPIEEEENVLLQVFQNVIIFQVLFYELILDIKRNIQIELVHIFLC